MTRAIFKPAKPLKMGAIVTVDISPCHTLQSEIVGFSGTNLLLDGWLEPVSKGRVR